MVKTAGTGEFIVIENKRVFKMTRDVRVRMSELCSFV